MKQVTLTKKEIRMIIRALSKLQLENYDVMELTNPEDVYYRMLQEDNKEIIALKSMLKEAIER